MRLLKPIRLLHAATLKDAPALIADLADELYEVIVEGLDVIALDLIATAERAESRL